MLYAAAFALAAWTYLLFLRGVWWRSDFRLGASTPPPARWPPVAAVVPARNESAVISRSIRSLLDQDYPGRFDIVLVDDESDDGTAEVAARVAQEHERGSRLCVVSTEPRPDGWLGKTWALHSGVGHADTAFRGYEQMFLTDADVVHEPDVLAGLVAKAESERLDLVSQMVELEVRGRVEGLLVPAFVHYFQMLYPFRWVNDPEHPTAAAAGGCVLLRRAALTGAGGIERIRSELIDDCALARAVKRNGPIWLGLTGRSRSIRPYGGLRGVWSVVARTAYTQLRHSPALLLATVLGMAMLHLVPPLAVLASPLHGDVRVASLGGAAWGMMAWSFLPCLRAYRRSLHWAFALPFAGVLYVAMTLDSARRHARGRGAEWKGRFANR